jgi:hypothetical protein
VSVALAKQRSMAATRFAKQKSKRA